MCNLTIGPSWTAIVAPEKLQISANKGQFGVLALNVVNRPVYDAQNISKYCYLLLNLYLSPFRPLEALEVTDGDQLEEVGLVGILLLNLLCQPFCSFFRVQASWPSTKTHDTLEKSPKSWLF